MSGNKKEGGIEMTVRIFSPEKHYDWENEVKQCDRIWSRIYEEFEDKDGEYGLFFDLKICGRQYDMILLTEDKVVIIEMKNKNGMITIESKYDWKVNYGHQFSLSNKKYAKYLEQGPIDHELISAFEDQGHKLDATAELFEEDEKWFILEDYKKKYKIKLGEEQLNIYKIEIENFFGQCQGQRRELFHEFLLPKYFDKENKFKKENEEDETIDCARYISTILTFPNMAEFNEYLFSLDKKQYKKYLKNDKLSDEIKTIFEEKDELLDDSAELSKDNENRWLIKGEKRKYKIEEIDDELKVYETERFPPYFYYQKEKHIVPQVNTFRTGRRPEIDVNRISKLIKKSAKEIIEWDEEKIERRLDFIRENRPYTHPENQMKSESDGKEVKKAFSQISKDLNSDDKDRVKKAIKTIRYLDLDGHKEEIKNILKLTEPQTKVIVLEKLMEMDYERDKESILKQFIDCKNQKLRKKTDEFMKFFGTPDSLRDYLDIIEESEDYSRVLDAVEVIGNIGNSNAVPSLLKLFEDIEERFGEVLKFRAKRDRIQGKEKKDEPPVKRKYYSLLNRDRKKILDTIIEIGDENSVKQLIDLYQDYEEKFEEKLEEESKVRRKISDSQLHTYEEILKKRKEDILMAIKEINPPSVVSLAKKYLDPDESSLNRIIDLLGESENKDALKDLERIIKNTRFREPTKLKAIEALGELEFEEGAEIIHEAIEKDPDLFKRKEVKDSLIKIGSRNSFDFLIDKYSLKNGYAVEVLIEINKKEFEEVLFNKLEGEDIKEKGKLLGQVSAWISDYNFKISENRLSQFLDILTDIIQKSVQIDYDLLEQVEASIQNDGKKSNLNRIVKNRELKYQTNGEKIETFDKLISNLGIPDDLLATKAYTWKAEYDGGLPWNKIRKTFLKTDKPELRKLGLEIIYEILRNHPDMADDVEIDEIIELGDDNSKDIILRALEVIGKEQRSVIIEEIDIEKSLLSVLGFIKTGDTVEYLLEYFQKVEDLSEEVLKSLNSLTRSERLEDYCKENDKTIPIWVFDYDKIKNLDGISVQTFSKMIGFYWGNQVVQVFEKLLDKNPEDRTLKFSIIDTLSNPKYKGKEVVLPLFEKLILDDDYKISSRAIRDFKELNDLHHSDDLIILKATERNLDEIISHC